ncbi:hypothetical protein QOZ80_7BG0610070 [Eleusine coracana subsp. coracana]|nr:hypothetical protein QOZ80_7BG0610070 [Eleusine coracana subsp. coracana]
MNLCASGATAEWPNKIEEYEREYAGRGYEPPPVDEESQSELDAQALQRYNEYRDQWISLWSPNYGSFEDITTIPWKRYTDEPAPPETYYCNTLQIFSARVMGLKHGLQWPLDVFGMVAVRDNVDRKRNIIFYRERDNCQTLTKKDPYLVLTGPTRAVVLTDPVTFEVILKVKGAIECQDKVLSFLAQRLILHSPATLSSRLFYESYTSNRSTLRFKFADIGLSVEATISVRVIDGSFPKGFHGQFAARTAGVVHDEDVVHEKVVLLDFGDENASFIGDNGSIELSRRVISVGVRGHLEVCVKVWRDEYMALEEDKVEFMPKDAGVSFGSQPLQVASCQMVVTVSWSLISSDPEPM